MYKLFLIFLTITNETNGMIILKRILKKQDMKMWTGFVWLRIGISVGCCEYNNEHSDSVKCRKVLD
jgi:hypothetical protein